MRAAFALLAIITGTASAESKTGTTGLAVGVEAGEPSSATVGFWLSDRIGVAAAIGTGTFAGPGLSLHADALVTATRVTPAMPLRLGVGMRWYDQHYAPASIDELPSQNLGLRATIALAYQRKAMELYAELAPGIDVHRTASCTLADGPMSICPHAMSSPLFLDFVVGARWFVGVGGGK